MSSGDPFKNLDTSLLKAHEERYQRASMLRKKSIMVLHETVSVRIESFERSFVAPESRKALTVCVVGAGDVGKEIADEISVGIDPSNIFMTARDPTPLASYAQLGILCTSDNAEACHRSRLIFLCCAPSHLATVARSMRGCVRRSSLLCSIVAGVSIAKLKSAVNAEAVVRCSVDSQRLRDGRTGYLELGYDDDVIIQCCN